MNTNAIGRFIAELRKQKVSLKRNIWACLKRAKKRISLSDRGCYMVGVGFLAAALSLLPLVYGRNYMSAASYAVFGGDIDICSFSGGGQSV